MMKKGLKRLLLIIMMVLSFAAKLDARAEVVWNTSGEKSPSGNDYSYKYWTGKTWMYCGNGELPELIDITYDVTYCYEEAYKMLDYVNAVRRKAGVPELQMKDDLMDAAMMRAAETAIFWSHTRPNGLGCHTASMFIGGENIHTGEITAKEANASLENSPGHYNNMTNPKWVYAGFGYIEASSGASRWVQIFCGSAERCYEDGYDAEFHRLNDKYKGLEVVYRPVSPNDRPMKWETMTCGNRKDYTASFTASVDVNLVKTLKAEIKEEHIYAGNTYIVEVDVKTVSDERTKNWSCGAKLTEDQYSVKVLTPGICSYSNGSITALKKGTAKIQYTLKADSRVTTVQKLEIQDGEIKKGSTVSVDGIVYKITSTKNRTVSLYNGKKGGKSITIPKTIKINGKTYKVISVADGAFQDNEKLQSVMISANIKKIGKEAFSGCKKLKKITVKSEKMNSVGSNALKGIHKKAVIKVPKNKLSAYKRLFKGKGQRKTVTIK